ncbi:helix-turn-helix domain-containing protein [Pseudonocardia sp. TRM90224]|uniref:helix-turn-helix domain-containing protein n=1 Tax=Pseudonocardia sp. TRM90224 TaxID=2812678 RepID=UPI001E3BEEEA|nr:helix-turn-helix transcriptional regulator [Pseudonocardia sp. TRM90224]
MSEEPARGLRAARLARGWSQSQAARELSALGTATGGATAAPASLKSLLSRWENGHALPDPQNRALLAQLYERTPAELGIAEPTDPAAGRSEELIAELATAAAADSGVVSLWKVQLAAARRLDDELGAAGAGRVVRALVEQLESTYAHSLTRAGRQRVGVVLAAASELAGAQALDLGRHDEAWHHFDRARTIAAATELPLVAVAATAGLASVLVDLGKPQLAAELLSDVSSEEQPAGVVRLAAARGITSAAAGEAAAARAAFAEARRAFPRVTVEVVEPTLPAIELADLDRWHGHALAVLGDTSAVEPLEHALAAEPRSARVRAGIHADLAVALAREHPEMASTHARSARELAMRIGSSRIPHRLSGSTP